MCFCFPGTIEKLIRLAPRSLNTNGNCILLEAKDAMDFIFITFASRQINCILVIYEMGGTKLYRSHIYKSKCSQILLTLKQQKLEKCISCKKCHMNAEQRVCCSQLENNLLAAMVNLKQAEQSEKSGEKVAKA